MDIILYEDESFIFDLDNVAINRTAALFDEKLQSKWDLKMNDEKVFCYQLNISNERNIGEKFFLQLNINRALLKRLPAPLHSINEPFNADQFNFNEIKAGEKLFVISNKNENSENSRKNIVIINVSPLEYGHVLLVPNPDKCFPQVLTEYSLKLAVEFSLLSRNKYFRVCFNSLGAYASVNHLHVHGYYLKRSMYLETAPVEEIIAPCYKIANYPGKGFVFQIRKQDEISTIVKNIFILVQLLQNRNIPHNLYITRGSDFKSSKLMPGTSDLPRNCLRIYLWARKPSWGAKELSAFNVATCELFGHMVIKNEKDYHTLTEESISATLLDITSDPFETVIPEVVKLYQN